MKLRIEPRHFLLALTVLALGLAWMVVEPFAKLLFLAAVVATVVSPIAAALARRMGGRRATASALVTLGLLVGLAGPLAGMGAVVVKQASDAVVWLTKAVHEDGVTGLVGRLPEGLQPLASRLADRLPHGAKEAEEAIKQALGAGAVSTVGGVLQATGAAFGQLVLFFVALFFFLSDGPALVEWLKRNLPLPAGRSAVLLGYLRTVTSSVVISTLATSGVQALLALVGYLIAGVPSALFFALLTFVTSFIPAVGTMLVWLPLAALRAGGGHPVAAGFLVAWGLLVVGMADNLVKPALIRRGVAFPVGLVFFALLGGLAAFGPVGLFAGPLVLAFLLAVVQAWRED